MRIRKVIGGRALLAALTFVGVLASASVAEADVLIDAPAEHITTSGCISIGVWYQSYSGGPHRVRASVYYHGERIASRRLYATTHWRDHVLTCPGYPHSGLYKVRVTGAGWRTTFPVHVSIDRD